MIEKIPRQRSFFNQYMFEAPGDDDKTTVSEEQRPRRIGGRPTTNRGNTDYGADDDSGDDNTPSDTPAAQTANNTADDGDGPTDYGAEDNTPDDTDDGDDQTPPADDNNDSGDDASDDDTATDYGADDGDDSDDDTSDDGGASDSGDEGDTGDDSDGPTDYGSDGSDDDNSDDASSDSGNQSSSGYNDNGDSKGEALRKYHMYGRFTHLYEVIENINEKLRDIVKDDPTQNAVIKRVTGNFNTLHDNLYDFMMVRFQKSSYVELLIYMENALAIAKLNLELLRNNRIELKQYPNDWC